MAKATPFDVSDDLDRLLALPAPKPVDISQSMILEIATGWEEPEAIAARYGYEGMGWERLKAYKPFVQAVEAQRAELERDGSIYRSKVKACTEEAFLLWYRHVMSSSATPGQIQSFVEYGSKVTDLYPKAAQVQSAPTGSVTIVFTRSGKDDPMTVDMVETPKAIST